MTTTDSRPRSGPGPASSLPGWLALGGVVGLMGARCLVSFQSQLVWAESGMDASAQASGFGSGATALTDFACVGLLVLAIWHGLRQGMGLPWLLLGLWVTGTGFAAFHGLSHGPSLRIGGHWSGALALGLAALILSRDPAMRRTLLAAAVALIIPLAIQGIHQVAVEHPATVRMYEKDKAKFLAQKGWEPGSTEQRQFERRLHQREATGRIGFSNIYGSLMMSLSLLALGTAWGLRSSGRWAFGSAAGLVLLGLASLALSGSKGAVGSFAAAGGAAALGLLLGRSLGWSQSRWWWRVVLLGLLVLAPGAVTARGLAGAPDTPAGERSLLFRFYYNEAAWRIWQEEPLVGVGPGRFGQAYVVQKNPLNPEDVSDPHNVFAAWIATLGVGGIAWSLLLLGLLWHVGSAAGAAAGAGGSGPACTSMDRGPPGGAMALGMGLVIAWGLVYWGSLMYLRSAGPGMGLLVGVLAWVGWRLRQDHHEQVAWVIWGIGALASLILLRDFGLWLIGGAGFLGTGIWLSRQKVLDGPQASLGVLAAAGGLVLHGEIEMSLTNPMSGPILMVLVGLAAAGVQPAAGAVRSWKPRAGLTAGLLLLSAMAWFHTSPLVAKEMYLHKAADEIRRGDMDHAVHKWLALAGSEHYTGKVPVGYLDEQVIGWRAHFLDRMDDTEEALDVLVKARRAGGNPGWLLRQEWLICAGRWRRVSVTPGASGAQEDLWRGMALEASARTLEHYPYDPHLHLEGADLAWDGGAVEQARSRYRQSLANHENSYLDPLRQLDPKELQRANERSAAKE